MDFPINSMVMFHSYGTVYQRVRNGKKKDDGLVLNRPRATTTQLCLSMIIYCLVVFDHVCWVIATSVLRHW